MIENHIHDTMRLQLYEYDPRLALPKNRVLQSPIAENTRHHVVVPVFKEFDNGNMLDFLESTANQHSLEEPVNVILVVNNSGVAAKEKVQSFQDNQKTLALVRYLQDKRKTSPYPKSSVEHQRIKRIKESGLQVQALDLSTSGVEPMTIGEYRRIGTEFAYHLANGTTVGAENSIISWMDADCLYKNDHFRYLSAAYTGKVDSVFPETDYIYPGGEKRALQLSINEQATFYYTMIRDLLFNTPDSVRRQTIQSITFLGKVLPKIREAIIQEPHEIHTVPALEKLSHMKFDNTGHSIYMQTRAREESMWGKEIFERLGNDDVQMNDSDASFVPFKQVAAQHFFRNTINDIYEDLDTALGEDNFLLNPISTIHTESELQDMLTNLLSHDTFLRYWIFVAKVLQQDVVEVIKEARGYITNFISRPDAAIIDVVLNGAYNYLRTLTITESYDDVSTQSRKHLKLDQVPSAIDEIQDIFKLGLSEKEITTMNEFIKESEQWEQRRLAVERGLVKNFIADSRNPEYQNYLRRLQSEKKAKKSGSYKKDRFLISNPWIIDWLLSEENLDKSAEELYEQVKQDFPDFAQDYDKTMWRKWGAKMRGIVYFLQDVHSHSSQYPKARHFLRLLQVKATLA